MKKVLRFLFWLVVAAVLIFGSAALYISIKGIPSYETQKVDLKIEVTPERIEHGLKLAQNLCIRCHLNKETNKLSGAQIVDLPSEFGVAYSANITNDKEHGIGTYTDGELAFLLRTGIKRNGKYSPPWMPKFVHASDEDIASIISFLRSDLSLLQADPTPTKPSEPSFLAKFLCYVAFKPTPYPDQPVIQPDTNNLVAYGKYLVAGRYECYPCHSADFRTMNIAEPEKTPGYFGGGNTITNMEGKGVHSANLTSDEETGIGKWTLMQFSDAVRLGKRPDGVALRYPMEPFPNLTDREVEAIYTYLRSIPIIKNKVDRNLVEL